MKCPQCNSLNFHVINSRPRQHYIHRRRECLDCSERWTTVEMDMKEFKALTRVNLYPAVASIAGKEMTLGYFKTAREADDAIRRLYSNLS